MAKRTGWAESKDSYAKYEFELSVEVILVMQCHPRGGPLVPLPRCRPT